MLKLRQRDKISFSVAEVSHSCPAECVVAGHPLDDSVVDHRQVVGVSQGMNRVSVAEVHELCGCGPQLLHSLQRGAGGDDAGAWIWNECLGGMNINERGL